VPPATNVKPTSSTAPTRMPRLLWMMRRMML
jgi:hypothetical protein